LRLFYYSTVFVYHFFLERIERFVVDGELHESELVSDSNRARIPHVHDHEVVFEDNYLVQRVSGIKYFLVGYLFFHRSVQFRYCFRECGFIYFLAQ
jgi:hypothetical protein